VTVTTLRGEKERLKLIKTGKKAKSKEEVRLLTFCTPYRATVP
jgi:hypothetical protein